MSTTSTQFQPTAQNMVQEVKNIIEGYRMGALRALAQDPVQNSLDAREGNNIVKVEYCLHAKQSRKGTPVWLLTVTDSGTSGLSGQIMDIDELRRRHYRLNESERWAAFEAQGFTKSGDDNIGSRGQGKSAFLYQSKVPPPAEDRDEERMLMLYDTLLPDDEYRLGVRFASPADVVRTPLINQDAISTVSSDFFQVDETIDPDLEVPLGLEPLKEVGTRVIVPFLRHETAMDIIKGTLSKWIERCWWRPIQKGELQVTIKFPSGNVERIVIPEWWINEPWLDKESNNIMEFKALKIDDNDDDLQIERLVLLHQDNLEAPEELHSTIPEFSGIQLLRHGQWVETLGAKSEFPDIIPFAHRDQFRGFVEFNEELDRRLRDIERPQHDSFDGRFTEVKQILATIESCVRQFARTQGWPIADETTTNENDVPDSQLMSNIIASFISPSRDTIRRGGGKGGKTDDEPVWNLNFDAKYPNEDSRINWEQSLTALSATCSHESNENDLWANIRLQIKGTTGRYQTIQQRYVPVPRTETMILFDDLQVVAHKTRNATDAPIIECPSPGKYTLKSAVIWNGKEVATQTKPFFVEEDPPPPPERNKQSIAIKIKNNTTGNDISSSPSRIRNRDILEISIIATNRDYTETHCELDASVRATVANEDDNSILLADEDDHILPAAIPGSAGAKQEILNQEIQIFTEQPNNKPKNQYVVLPPGRHRVSADLFIIASDEPPAHTSKNLYVEVDPTAQSANMPFRFNPIDTATAPLWELKEENIGSGEWTLNYNRSNELYKQTVAASASMRTKLAFYGHICVEALIDWAMIPYLERRDESNLDILRDSAQVFNNTDLTERYLDEIQKLVDRYGTTSYPSEYAIAFNECRRNMGGIMNNVIRQREQQ